MKKDRDMMYYGMGYQMMPYPTQNTYPGINENTNDFESRLNRIEKQLRRLDSRISRLENPYPDAPNYQTSSNTELPFKIDNTMYMM